MHKTGTSPHVLATLNRRLMIRSMPRRYTAIQYAVFNPHSHELQIASAGMPGPFHLSASGCRNLKLWGIPPGLFAAANYETLTCDCSQNSAASILNLRMSIYTRPSNCTTRATREGQSTFHSLHQRSEKRQHSCPI